MIGVCWINNISKVNQKAMTSIIGTKIQFPKLILLYVMIIVALFVIGQSTANQQDENIKNFCRACYYSLIRLNI